MKRLGFHRGRSRSLVTALYLNTALLGAILVALLSGGNRSLPQILPAAYGQNQLPIAGGAGVFIVPAQFAPGSFGCYLMDVDAQTICAYQYANSKLKLVAARSFQYDRKLKNYNTEMAPEEIRKLVDLELQGNRVLDRNTERPSPEAPAKQE